MRRILVLLTVVLISSGAIAQKKQKDQTPPQPVKDQPKKELPQPFKGGVDSMQMFFKDNITLTPQILKAKASGSAIIKFSVESKGMINSIVVYYADDYLLTTPAIAALRLTNGKWVIPSEVKSYDFVIQFNFNFKPDGSIKPTDLKSILDFYQHHHPIIAKDQVPLDYATLLPTVVVDYQ